MIRMVADASVIVKWVFPSRSDEADTGKALKLLETIKAEQIGLYQPPHWLAETAAVITRLSPETALEDIDDLYEMEFPVMDTPEIYATACNLSRTLDHHLFDTLYHAVALHLDDTALVTANERYYQKARDRGRISLLADFDV